MVDIVDLHCDLLAYLQRDRNRSAYDQAVHCAIPQMRKGEVRLQTMAIFSETGPGSETVGWQQYQIFKTLPNEYPHDFKIFENDDVINSTSAISILLAIENASAFCGEEEPVQNGIDRLMTMQQEMEQILYMSLTWNEENRFGGGALTDVGIKEDGKCLLRALDDTGIAVDLSHASDRLAHDIINTIDSDSLDVPIIASHSNMRSVTDNIRNLPDPIVREIIARDGMIGLSLIRPFVGEEGSQEFVKHVDHLLNLGGEYHIGFGADFFYPSTLSESKYWMPEDKLFYSDCNDAACYPIVLDMLRQRLGLPEATLARLAHRNVLRRVVRYRCYSRVVNV